MSCVNIGERFDVHIKFVCSQYEKLFVPVPLDEAIEPWSH